MKKNKEEKALQKSRQRARRMRSLMKRGMTQEQIDQYFANENTRLILCLLYGSYSIQDGTIKKEIVKRGPDHKVKSKEVKEIPNILHGLAAAKKFAENEGIEVIAGRPTSIWVKTDVEHVDEISNKLLTLGRISITKPEIKVEKKEKTKKPTNNTAEVKTKAKETRKKQNIEKANMRPYYAALRKGGVCARIKKYNKTLADKIEKWMKERKATEAQKAEKSKEHRVKHHQLTSFEMKANKRARKAAKHLAANERRREREKKLMENNAKQHSKRPQKAQKPIQTKLKMAA